MPQSIITHFEIQGSPVSVEPYGHGHINTTFLIGTNQGEKYVLQRINKYVFTNPPQLMENAGRVTDFIRSKGEMAQHFLRTADGDFCYQDDSGEFWRAYKFLNGFSLDIPETVEDFYQSALAFGRFQNQLADFPAETLYETIPNFHNTPDRYRQLKESIAADKMGRVATAQPEIDFYLAQESLACKPEAMRQDGILPLRVTHNDTKLNNVLLDNITRKALCVLDLDTVMPGLSIFDFGDAVRFGANTAAEDEKDASKMKLDLEKFRACVKGTLEAAPALTDTEVTALPLGAFTMTVECGSRFLKDYLDGDIYFRTQYDTHNLVRCRTQMALAADILKRWNEMEEIVQEIANTVRK